MSQLFLRTRIAFHGSVSAALESSPSSEYPYVLKDFNACMCNDYDLWSDFLYGQKTLRGKNKYKWTTGVGTVQSTPTVRNTSTFPEASCTKFQNRNIGISSIWHWEEELTSNLWSTILTSTKLMVKLTILLLCLLFKFVALRSDSSPETTSPKYYCNEEQKQHPCFPEQIHNQF